MRRLLCGRVPVPPGKAEPLDETERIRPLAALLRDAETAAARFRIWQGFQVWPDAADWSGPVSAADPSAPPPEEGAGPEEEDRVANVGDLRKQLASTIWPWPGWLVGGALNTLASDPGDGKTILAMNLARILWNGWPWPDGATNPMPAGTKTLWVPGDRHHRQILDLTERYGMPDEAVLFNARSREPAGGYDLDDEVVLAGLKSAIASEKPGLVIVDTVVNATRRNLGRPEEATLFFGPLMDMAGESGVPFLLLTHLSKDTHEALGRRIIGSSRVVWKLTKPDAEGQPDRRKVWVDKSYMLCPSPIGMTIGENGATFDTDPPISPAEQRAKVSRGVQLVVDWLREQLAEGPVRLTKLIADAKATDISVAYLYKARDTLGVVEHGGRGRTSWALTDDDAADPVPEDDEPLFRSSRVQTP